MVSKKDQQSLTRSPKETQSSKSKYQQLSDREQILHRPDMYMGPIKTSDACLYVYDKKQNMMVYQDLNFNSGLLKIFDEVITNAQDQAIRTRKNRKKTKNIYVQINKQTGVITVCNDGPSIEIQKHSESKIYIPELIFGNLRTSENYDDSQTDRRVGGLNGLGVKLTNIYSKYLDIDIMYNGKRYQQRFENNMSVTNPPDISKEKTKDPDYVRVTFLPDYQKFGLNSLTNDMSKIMKKRVYDCAGSCSKLVNTYLNDRLINVQSFKDYCNLYLSEDTYQLQIEQPKEISDIKIKNKNYTQSQELRDDTQIIIAQSDGNSKQISFINNVNTIKGGKHVDYIMDLLQKEIISALKKKRGNKDLKFSSSFVKENICIFLNMHVYQPTFSSQAKDEFSSDITTWGYVPIIEEKYIKKIVDSPIGQAIMDRVSLANDKPVAKNEGKKKKTLGFIDGLVDATKAGTSESNKCVLFLVEGKSAAQLVISGRSQIPNGVDHYGVFALRGKVLNVKDASQKKILANNEITQIKQILGLQQGKVYKDTSELRYGKILIATDADSVSGDTPILLRKNGQVEIQSIERIGKDFKSEDIFGKEYGNPDGYECWSDEGWTEIKHVMRHRTTKRMFRVLTHTGVVDVTEDHSLLDINKNKVTPGQLQIGQDLLHSYPQFLDNKVELPKNIENLNKKRDLNKLATQFNIKQPNKINKDKLIENINEISQQIQYLQINSEQSITISKDEAFIMGLFFGDGHASTQIVPRKYKLVDGTTRICKKQYLNWYINNNDLQLLQNTQQLCKKVYGQNINFKIDEIKKYENTYGINQKYKLVLLGGVHIQNIIQKYVDLFYYKNQDSKYQQGNKFINFQMLNQPYDIRLKFIEGYYQADGQGHDIVKKNCRQSLKVAVESKISAQSIYYMCKSIGYMVTIYVNDKKPTVYNLTLSKSYKNRNPNIVKKIIDLGITEQYVYDLETQNHRFQAGVGSCVVSNTDGFHISALCSNLFQTIWPSLLKFESTTFINRFLTPIIIATKKTGKQEQIDFYTQQDFDNWLEQNESQISRWKVKYFKGLAVFDQNSGKRHFKTMRVMRYHWQPTDDQYFTLAFDKKNAAQRKLWLQNYDKNAILDYNSTQTTYTELINKELIHFSVDDVARSICSLMDGLKPSQRKILYSCFKRKLWNDELRVAQLAGYTSEQSSYEHGENSLQGAIVQMAQDFVGTNNINLLLPNGQFGTRYDPKASGAPRYIHTQLNSIVKILMNQDDNAILNYLKDDENMSIEPEYYLPIIPMALVNGCIGIGTGFSTKIPNYNPIDIIHNLQILLQQQKNPETKSKTKKSGTDHKFVELVPYYKGFTGQIKVIDSVADNTDYDIDDDNDDDDDNQDQDQEEDDYADTAQSKRKKNGPKTQYSHSSIGDQNQKYVSIGVFKRIGKTSKIQVTEIPIGKTIKGFVDYIKKNFNKPQSEVIEDIRDDGFTLTIDFQDPDIVDKLFKKEPNKDQPKIYKSLQLINQIHITNMYMFNDQGQITKYHSPMEVLYAFFEPRLIQYQKRKDYILQQLEKDIFILKQKARFIMDIISGQLDLRNKKQQLIISELLQKGYLPLDNHDQSRQDLMTTKPFDFLTEMPISSYTLEKKDQLLKNLKDKEDRQEYIKNKHIADMWYEELDQLKSHLISSFKYN